MNYINHTPIRCAIIGDKRDMDITIGEQTQLEQKGIFAGDINELLCPCGDHDYIEIIQEVVWNWKGRDFRVTVFRLTTGNYLLMSVAGSGSAMVETKDYPPQWFIDRLVNYLSSDSVGAPL